MIFCVGWGWMLERAWELAVCKEYAQLHLFVSKEGNDCLSDEKTPAHKIKRNSGFSSVPTSDDVLFQERSIDYHHWKRGALCVGNVRPLHDFVRDKYSLLFEIVVLGGSRRSSNWTSKFTSVFHLTGVIALHRSREIASLKPLCAFCPISLLISWTLESNSFHWSGEATHG
jgi:hypothetical protein